MTSGTTATACFSPQLSPAWTGRHDGDDPSHRLWYTEIAPLLAPEDTSPGVALIGFASDEGIRRNMGRLGAADGPEAIRAKLGWMALHDSAPRYDAGTVTVAGENLEAAQEELATAVARTITGGHLPIVLGGGHDAAFGSHSGLRRSLGKHGTAPGIINLDAHLDLRQAERATNGTPFRQIAETFGEDFDYSVIGVSAADNTDFLFEAAREFGVTVVEDHELSDTTSEQAAELARDWVSGRDSIHLSIDLDVLNQSLAPGVTSPAAVGVSITTIRAICLAIAHTGRLGLVDVVELSPPLDIDDRTARVAARLIQEISQAHVDALAA